MDRPSTWTIGHVTAVVEVDVVTGTHLHIDHVWMERLSIDAH
ncbi:MAG: hypothetical protein OES57_14405 [Acidimicrobiia bacterium]|nr:hypothetical protein [Acidimicrobiia bacterium]